MLELELEPSWQSLLKDEFSKPYFLDLQDFLEQEVKNKKIIFPQTKDIFNALNTTSFEDVKVVILGQDPYHGPGQAHGLCFSVLPKTKVPPSLKNIYKEMKTDLGIEPIDHGYLQSWAEQGVLMLNAVLTVEASTPGSHRKKGWEQFTDKIISCLNERKEYLVFILWGNDAKKKKIMLDANKHLIIESSHPSPFSVKNFYGSRPFSKTNNYLKKHHLIPIDWQLPSVN